VSSLHSAPKTTAAMRVAAEALLESLSSQQASVGHMSFSEEERYNWSLVPLSVRQRAGLRLVNMTIEQQELAFELVRSGLSERGFEEARQIIHLDSILRELDRSQKLGNDYVRDPEMYKLAIFGQPGSEQAWTWRVEGHHLSLHFTVRDKHLLSPAPLFLGAMPATVPGGPEQGLRTLEREAALGRALLATLSESQRESAVVSREPNVRFRTGEGRHADSSSLPKGLAFSEMSSDQKAAMTALVLYHLSRWPDEIADQRWARIEDSGLDRLSFGWSGGDDPNDGHCYLIRGTDFVIEYENSAGRPGGANHPHVAWRELVSDWGDEQRNGEVAG